MKLSVIIPTLNRPDSVEDTLIHIFESNILPDEIIIVDQSDDKEIERIIRKYEDKMFINYIHISEKGSTHARNIGIEKATGNIIIFMDDDVRVKKDTFENIKNIMQDKKISMIAGINLNANNKTNKFSSLLGYIFFTKNYFKNNIGYVTDTMLGRFPVKFNERTNTEWAMGYFFVVRKELIDKWNLRFDEKLISYAYAEDLDFSYSYYLKSKKEDYNCIIDKKVQVWHMTSQEFRITKWKHTVMYIINREYLSYKYKKSSYSRLKQRWTNIGRFFERIISKDSPKDIILAMHYCDKYRKDIKNGILHTELYDIK